jgi:hypothetical protein
MFIEFVESLRCLRAHEDSWLVAAADRMAGRSIVEGRLGCPVCRAEYPIVGGVAYFGVPVPAAGAPAAPVPREDAADVDPDLVLRAAALLGLADPGGTAVLGGRWGPAAGGLRELAAVHCLLVDPPYEVGTSDGLSVVRTAGRLPLAAGSVRGVALDEASSTPAALDDSVRALRARGRLVAPARSAVPAGVRELARDARHWVAEREAAPTAPVKLARRRDESR